MTGASRYAFNLPTPTPLSPIPTLLLVDTLGAPPDKPNKLRRKSSLSTAGMRPRTAPVAFSPDDVTDMFTEISVIQGSQEEDNTSSGASVTKDDDPSTQQQRQFKRAPRFSIATKERSIAAKIYFEHYFDRLFSGKSSNPTASSSRTRRRIQIEQELDRLGVSDAEKTKIREEWLAKERVMTRTSRDRMSLEKFEVIKPLGKGAFGFVRLVREKASGVLYAMKTLKKE